ncbi:hypothetical protein Sste5346_009541, partial [Sporothrix stenoceras]
PPRYLTYRFRLVFDGYGYLIQNITAPLVAGKCGSYLLLTPLPPVPPTYYDYTVATINNEGRRTHATLKKVHAARDVLETIAIPSVGDKARDLAFTVRNYE